jgi:ketosteroid isomerase-like protein
MEEKLDLIKRYFNCLERLPIERTDFESFLHPEIEQHEFPNLLNRRGQKSDFPDVLRRAAVAKTILSSQTYEINNSIESGNQLVIEATWTGKMAKETGPLKMGQELKAYFCIVCEFKDGKIYRQRNYDCFDEFT